MELEKILSNRILILDGAMGTMIQRYKLTEADFRGERFSDWHLMLKGNNDLLSLARPDIIGEIHRQYLAAGADIIETNTFNATSISQEDYQMGHLAAEINRQSARLAREAADEYSAKTPSKPRFVAGSIGPTNKTASISPRVDEPMFRSAAFDDFKAAYKEQIYALVEGGVDLLLIETIFDTLNAKAAIFAANEVAAERAIDIPLILSVTISDRAGRTLSGQTPSAFVASISHAKPLAIGVNCSLGAAALKPYVKELGLISPYYICSYPNAGLPNQLGEYEETPKKMAEQISEFIDEGLVNIVGGCCGTTPEHIAEFVAMAENALPHKKAEPPAYMQLSGLELLEFSPQAGLIQIGERCNVAGSRRFLRLIQEKRYDEALDVARKQVEDGARVLDINMDDGLLDGVSEMTYFLNMLASDPDVSRLPIMIDSSDWDVLEAGLKAVQGKSIVNSISLKSGESEFLRQAELVQQYGAAVVVMAFDESGQANSYERRIEISARAYRLLTNNGFDPKDIVFDPNILAVATGMEDDRNYAVDFIKTISWIKENLPHAKVSGGVSNLSFAFRGNSYIRELMHAVFLFHAVQAGLDMAIINPTESLRYDLIPLFEKELLEDLLFNRRDDATERLIAYAESSKAEIAIPIERSNIQQWRNLKLEERLSYALIKGVVDYLEEDLNEAVDKYPYAVDIIDKPLMEGINRVGELFGAGKMFLPQVVKAARTMKKAVAILEPILDKQSSEGGETRKAGKILLATVRGDVHDIGKNIVSIILSCNNYEVIDLGVMVPPEKIIRAILEEQPDIVGLSGLITPSLSEMEVVAQEMQRAGVTMPLLIGGATTSKLHTALKIAPHYSSGVVLYVKDASQAPFVVSGLMSDRVRDDFILKQKEDYRRLREMYRIKVSNLVPLDHARVNAFKIDWNLWEPVKPNYLGRKLFSDIKLSEIEPFIDWRFLFTAWNLPSRFHTIRDVGRSDAEIADWLNGFDRDDREKGLEAAGLYNDAVDMLKLFIDQDRDYIKAIVGFYEAYGRDDTIVIREEGVGSEIEFPLLRQQSGSNRGKFYCLSDFIAPESSAKKDWIALFTVTAGYGADRDIEQYENSGDQYNALLMKSLLDRLAEAATEWLHAKVRRELWGYAVDEDIAVKEMLAAKYQGIRPAVGYPSLPDQSANFLLHSLLVTEEIAVSLTENGVMYPTASVSGLMLAHPDSRYFAVGKIGTDQLSDYSRRKGKSSDEIRKFLLQNLG